MKISGDFARYQCDVDGLSAVHKQFSLKIYKQRRQYAPMTGCNGSELKMAREQQIPSCFEDVDAKKRATQEGSNGSAATCHKKYAQNQRL